MFSSRKKRPTMGQLSLYEYKCCLRFYTILVKTTFNSLQNTKRTLCWIDIPTECHKDFIIQWCKFIPPVCDYKNGLKHNNH